MGNNKFCQQHLQSSLINTLQPIYSIHIKIIKVPCQPFWIEGRRTEDDVHWTDCEAQRGNVIMILGFMNRINLIWISKKQCCSFGPEITEYVILTEVIHVLYIQFYVILTIHWRHINLDSSHLMFLYSRRETLIINQSDCGLSKRRS